MSVEEIVEQILSKHPKTSKEDLLERLEKEKRKMGIFFSDETLLKMIAAELGVEVSVESSLPKLLIENLIPSLNNVTVVGRVVAVFSPKIFGGLKEGKVASLFIADKSDILRVVFWNDKTDLIESGKVKVGQIIRFSHGYTREDRGGIVELHMGEKGDVEINPGGVAAKDYPTISRFATKIKDLTKTQKNKKVNVIGTVKELFSASTFQREDSSSGKVMRFVLYDGTGEISVVVWNEKVDELEKTLKKGLELQIVNAKAKKAVGEGFEIHVNSETYIGMLRTSEEILKIADLKEGLNRVNVEGEVVSKPLFRDIKTSKGEVVRLATFELKDETGKIWVSAWRKYADHVKDLKVADKILVKNAYVKKGFGDQLELSTRSGTSIVPSSQTSHC